MAPKSVLVTFNILLLAIIVGPAIAGREIPNTDSKNTNLKQQPESFIDKDGRILIPGIGGFTLPGVHSGGFNPFTGTNGGLGLPSPRSYIPGGDDTFVPNPGFEVPIPGSTGGSTPVAAVARP